jgi:NAD(P)-dependent dehydrogenase (short-subunit alcohol dehydrogenase family)
MFCRSQERAEDARKELINLTNNEQIDIFLVDFSNLSSIEMACKEFKAKYQSLDVLVNNAGATFAKFELSEDGIEKTMAVNHFGYFATTYHLLPLLSKGARIVNVSSKAHYGGHIDLDTINTEKGYFVFKQYEISKLANVLFTKSLARKLEDKGITVNCLHPGVVKTKIGNKAGNKLFGFIWTLFSSFGLNTDQGAATSIYLASSDEVENITGMYFDKCKAYKGSELSRNEKLQEEFWKWSEELSEISWNP